MKYKQEFNRLLIFDGSHALHRALSVPNNWDMKTSKGIRTGGIYGVLRTILKECKTYNYYPIVVFDGGLSERRLQIYPNYKRTLDKQQLNESLESKTDEQLVDEMFRQEYNTQRDILKELLPCFNIPVICLDKWEGDDLIYILTKMCKDSIVVSDDKDLLQLINEDDNYRCRVRRAMRDEFWDINTLKEKNLNIQEYIACKAIVGDPSDNIPSACFQVGEKTAPSLYKLYTESSRMIGGFPKDEKELTEKCKLIDVPKRKAYLNFNVDQFLTNVLLTDLSLIDKEVNDDIIEYINLEILADSEFFSPEVKSKMLNIIEDLEIKTININEILDKTTYLKDVLKINDIEKSKNLVEINISNSGAGLFNLNF